MQAPLLGALVLALVAPVAGAEPSRQLVITQAESGKTFRLLAGTQAELHLSGKWTWSPPAVRGDSVDLTQINYFRDPGYSGWAIEARTPGRASIRSNGVPSCRLCPRTARRFVVTIVVLRKPPAG